MSRIRSVKPEFWTSEQVLECSTNARLLFLGLWNFCDDCGRHPYSAKQAKAEVFPSDPFTEKQILALLGELETNGLICRYISGDKEYFYVTGWKHQRIDKPQPAKYPDPFAEDSKNVPRVIPPDTIGRDTIGKDICAVKDRTDAEFDEFWKVKPGRGKSANPKAPALKAYRSAVKDGADPAEINAAARRWALDEPKPGTEFVAMASTWINQKRFDDYKPQPPNPASDEFMRAKGYEWQGGQWQKTEIFNERTEGKRVVGISE